MDEERTAEYVVARFTGEAGADAETAQMILEAAATMTPEDLVEEFRVACDVLDGLVVMAEAVNWAAALRVLGVTALDADSADRTLGAVLKYDEDQEVVRAAGLEELVRSGG